MLYWRVKQSFVPDGMLDASQGTVLWRETGGIQSDPSIEVDMSVLGAVLRDMRQTKPHARSPYVHQLRRMQRNRMH